jgi:hypothetical protein
MLPDDTNSELVKQQISEFDEALQRSLGDRGAGIEIEDDDEEFETPDYTAYADDTNGEEPTMPEADEFDHDAFDKYISARLILPDAEGVNRSGKIMRRKRDHDGNLIGRSNRNPILDTSLYEIEFDDGQTGTYAANIVAENIFEQLDDEGQAHTLFSEIVDHKKMKDAIHPDDGFVQVHGRRMPKRTTRGWKLCVKWKDDSTSWIWLKDLKESYPLQVAE